jgi:hypothetical protein
MLLLGQRSIGNEKKQENLQKMAFEVGFLAIRRALGAATAIFLYFRRRFRALKPRMRREVKRVALLLFTTVSVAKQKSHAM